MFAAPFPESNNANSIPDNSIQSFVKKFESMGSVLNLLKRGRIRKQTEELKE